MSDADALPKSLFGPCSVCGQIGSFENTRHSPREGYECRQCRASLRYRHQADAIVHHYSRRGSASLAELVAEPGFAALQIYEPGLIGPFRDLLKNLPGYVQSYYWEDVEPGAERKGIRCENLERLTFQDGFFDLMISSDIFEHVRHPEAAFAETFRILRPGGKHIFTVPVPWPWPPETRARVDVSTEHDQHILPPVYHGSPHDPEGSLVYNDFGLDLVDRLERIGFEVRVPRLMAGNITFVATKPVNSSGLAKEPEKSRKKAGLLFRLLR